MRDIYLYDDVPVLKNKLNIKDKGKLDIAETDITTARMLDIDDKLICHKGEFSLDYLKKIHSHIFSDIYEWAGETRKINIEKSERLLNGLSVQYSDYNYIEKDFNEVMFKVNSVNWKDFKCFDNLVSKFSECISALWKVHAFREGNTRSTMKFVSHFARANEIPFKDEVLKVFSGFARDALVMASLGIYANFKYLNNIIGEAIIQGNDELNKKRIQNISEFHKNQKHNVEIEL